VKDENGCKGDKIGVINHTVGKKSTLVNKFCENENGHCSKLATGRLDIHSEQV
jgi:hypothetical protein